MIDNLNPFYSIKLKKYNISLSNHNNNQFLQNDIGEINLKDFDCEYFFHFAAQPSVRYSIEHQEEVFKTNFMQVMELLEKIRMQDISLKRFVYVSSSSVFGRAKYLPIDERHPRNPISPNGRSKLAAENLTRDYYRLYGIPIVIIRPFTVVGERQRPDMGLHKFIESMIQKRLIIIYGDGTQTRDWTHVKDIIEGISLTTKKSSAIGEEFNLGSGIRMSVNQILKKISGNLNVEYEVIYVSITEVESKDMQVDITKAKRILGFYPKLNLNDAIIEQIKFFQDHRELYIQ